MNRRRNLRDEEARVIGVQDDAALEMRRVKARRPHDAAERRDKKSQESRVGSRERNARDEMTRLRGKAVGMGMKTGGKTVKKNMGGGMDEGINAAIKRSSAAATKKAEAIDTDAIASNPRVQAAKKNYEYEQTPEGKAFVDYMKNYLKDDFAEQRANKRSNWRADRAKKPLTGLDSEGEGNNKGGKVVKKKVGGKTRPRAPAPKPSSARQMSMLIPQHKRMAMGENVLTGKMIKKADGGRIERTKAPNRAPATTGVNLNMGAPKTRRTTARGMGAATRGGNFTENT